MDAISTATANRRRAWALLAALVLPLIALPFAPPVAQDPNYHAFVDARAWFGIPNFWNVASNAPFLIIGFIGVRLCARRRGAASLSWITFFGAVALVAFGSSWYHLHPNDDTLVWDRLPMTIAFMALFSALLVEHLDLYRERALLTVLVVTGLSSVAWWRLTGDLKFYVWVQVAPFLAIAVLLSFYPARYTQRYWLAVGFVCYSLAKVLEFSDARVYSALSSAMSGHSLKHFIAALAPLCVYEMLKRRSRVG